MVLACHLKTFKNIIICCTTEKQRYQFSLLSVNMSSQFPCYYMVKDISKTVLMATYQCRSKTLFQTALLKGLQNIIALGSYYNTQVIEYINSIFILRDRRREKES